MRIGVSEALAHKTPEEWAKRNYELGCGAVVFPLDYTCEPEKIDEYAEAARRYHLSIAEVGVWCNPLSPDKETRKAALQKCKGQLRLADRIGAECCVNVSGSKGMRWDGAYRENLSEKTWEEMIRCIQEIIDETEPQNTYYTIEPMPWMYPMGPDEYLRMIEEVNREHFAVHMDICNWITTPGRYLFQEEFMEECFQKLGGYIKSCHLKDVRLRDEFTFQVQEAACGEGTLCLEKYGKLIDKISSDMPVIIEHLGSEEEYLESLSYVKQRFAKAGIYRA